MKLVSIPDRYSKNGEAVRNEGELVPEFQFLIGTLKTNLSRWWYTQWYIVSIPDRYSKNTGITSRPMKRSCVSIPDRYSKNADRYSGVSYLSTFQFLIGTLKTHSPCVKAAPI